MMSFAVAVIMKATVVCGCAFVLSWLSRRVRASFRHMLFALAFAALIAIPVLGILLPAVTVRVPYTAIVQEPSTADKASPALVNGSARPSEFDISLAAGKRAALGVPAAEGSVMIAQSVIAVWLFGVALFLTPVVVGLWQVRRLLHAASPWGGEEALLQTPGGIPGAPRTFAVFLHEGVTGPITCGVLKPAIIFPANVREWDAVMRRCALRHELEHVARWDFLTLALSRIVCAVYWFHPLVWAAWRRLRLEAERACDDAVVREDDATDYASLLISIAQREAVDARGTALAMAGRDDLAVRVGAVLDDGQSRGRMGHGWATAMVVLGMMAITGFARITVARELRPSQAAGTAPSQVRFETASIRRNTGIGTPWSSRVQIADGALLASNVTARMLVATAYRVRAPHQIDNAPAWIDSDRFDVVARMPAGVTSPQLGLKSLLAERFQLVAHHGSREFPMYALVPARSNGGLGPRITPSLIDCRSKPGSGSPCGLSSTVGRLVGRGVTMAQLVRVLPDHLGSRIAFDRPLTDDTGLDGAFDFTLEWTLDPVAQDLVAPSQAAPRVLEFRPYDRPLESNAPNFLAALIDQLGLKFENRLAPETVLIIDRIEPPIEN